MALTFTRRAFAGLTFALAAGALMPAHAADFRSDRITVTSQGAGPDVVLIPGLGSSPKVWTELVQAVPGYRYHFVQVHGFAGTPVAGNKEGPVAAPVAGEVARYIAETGLAKPAVIGHSMGGTMGLMLAARHPESLSRLMVIDMVPYLGVMFAGPAAPPEKVKAIADGLLAQQRAAEPKARAQRIEATIAGMVNNEALRPVALDDSLKSDQDVSARSYHELIVTNLIPELGRIRVPTSVLFVVPKGVPMTEEQMTAAYKAAYSPIPGATVKFVPGSAHFIMWDASERFHDEVRGFLGAR